MLVTRLWAPRLTTETSFNPLETSNPLFSTQTSLAGPVALGLMPKGPAGLGTGTWLMASEGRHVEVAQGRAPSRPRRSFADPGEPPVVRWSGQGEPLRPIVAGTEGYTILPRPENSCKKELPRDKGGKAGLHRRNDDRSCGSRLACLNAARVATQPAGAAMKTGGLTRILVTFSIYSITVLLAVGISSQI